MNMYLTVKSGYILLNVAPMHGSGSGSGVSPDYHMVNSSDKVT